jgi:hypothetical protein
VRDQFTAAITAAKPAGTCPDQETKRGLGSSFSGTKTTRNSFANNGFV